MNASTARSMLIDITPLRISAAYRRTFVARLISLVGIGMLLVAVPVQMWDLTGSSVHVGVATAVTGIATFVGMLVGGILADRFDRKLLILAGRTGAAIGFAVLAANAFGAFGGSASVGVLYAVAVADGLIGSLSASALMAAVPTLIPRKHLAAVGALGSLTVRVGSTISPGIAGFIIGAGGVGWTYVVATAMAVTTVLVLLGLPALPPHGPLADERHSPDGSDPHGQPAASASGAARSGPASTPPVPLLQFLRTTPVIVSVMVVGVLAMLATGLVALIPALVSERFDEQTGVVGYLMAAMAAGALVATLTSGWIGRLARPGLVLMTTMIASFALIALLGATSSLWPALIVLVVVGFLNAIQEVVRYMLIQQHTPGPLLGRINGIWMAQEVGGVSIGALVAGGFGALWAAGDAVVYYGLVLCGLGVLAAVALGSLRRVRGISDEEPVSAS